MINKKIILVAIVAVLGGVGVRSYTVHNTSSAKTSSGYATSLEDKSNNGTLTSVSFESNNKEDTEKKIDVDNGSSTSSSTTNPTKPNKPTSPSVAESKPASNVVADYKEFFKKDVFMGDSITDGISYGDFLKDINVCAKIGININNAKEQINSIEIQNPRNIYLLYGVNDMDDRTPSEWFVGQYRELVHKIKSKFPNTNIYVQSILPVSPTLEQKNPHINNKHINETNKGLINMAKEEGISYLNIASVLNENNKDLYEQDGTHFKSPFYTLWLNYVANNVK